MLVSRSYRFGSSLGPCSPHAVDFISRMQALIENLVKLQAIELERGRRIQDLRALPAEIAKAQT